MSHKPPERRFITMQPGTITGGSRADSGGSIKVAVQMDSESKAYTHQWRRGHFCFSIGGFSLSALSLFELAAMGSKD